MIKLNKECLEPLEFDNFHSKKLWLYEINVLLKNHICSSRQHVYFEIELATKLDNK